MEPYSSVNDLNQHGLNDLNRLSIEDNTNAPSSENKRHCVYGERDLTHVRESLEDIRRRIESKNLQTHFHKPETRKSSPLLSTISHNPPTDPEETFKKETLDTNTDERNHYDDTAQVQEHYAKHVQLGNQNMMLICEQNGSESERVYYKQVGDKNIMVNLTHSSMFYQLLTLAQEIGQHKVFPLTSDGEIWVEIKRRSQVFRDRSGHCSSQPHGGMWGSQQSSSRRPGSPLCRPSSPPRRPGSPPRRPSSPPCRHASQNSVRSFFSSSDNMDYCQDGAASSGRQGDEHDESRDSVKIVNHRSVRSESLEAARDDFVTRRKSPTENDDGCESVALRDSWSFDEDAYSTIDIDDNNEDVLLLKFEKQSGKGLDRNHMTQSMLSHKKVRQFLDNEGNDFDVKIYDWEYQKDTVYSCVDNGALDILIEGDYSIVTDRLERAPPLPARQTPQQNAPLYSQVIKNPSVESVPVLPPRRGLSLEPLNTSQATISPKFNSLPTPPKFNSLPIPPNINSLPTPTNTNTQPTTPTFSSLPNPPRPLTPSTPSTTANTDPLPLLPPRSPLPPTSPGSNRPLFPPTPVTEDLEGYSWYKGSVDTATAKQLLENKPTGTFLVRKSVSPADSQHRYTIEFVGDHRNMFKKLKIMQTGNRYHFHDQSSQRFDRLSLLIETIITSGLEIQDDKTQQWRNIKVRPIT